MKRFLGLISQIMSGVFAFILVMGLTTGEARGGEWKEEISIYLAITAPGDVDTRVPRSQCKFCNGTGKVKAGDGRTLTWRECEHCYPDNQPPSPSPQPAPQGCQCGCGKAECHCGRSGELGDSCPRRHVVCVMRPEGKPSFISVCKMEDTGPVISQITVPAPPAVEAVKPKPPAAKPRPAEQKVESDRHSHLCPHCRFEWWHTSAETAPDHDKAHRCPKCGTQQHEVNRWASGHPPKSLQGATRPVKRQVLSFGASWCGPCMSGKGDLLPQGRTKTPDAPLTRLAQEGVKVNDLTSADIRLIDYDGSPDLAKRYNVTAVPTEIVLENGVEVDRHVGVVSYDWFKTAIGR